MLVSLLLEPPERCHDLLHELRGCTRMASVNEVYSESCTEQVHEVVVQSLSMAAYTHSLSYRRSITTGEERYWKAIWHFEWLVHSDMSRKHQGWSVGMVGPRGSLCDRECCNIGCCRHMGPSPVRVICCKLKLLFTYQASRA